MICDLEFNKASENVVARRGRSSSTDSIVMSFGMAMRFIIVAAMSYGVMGECSTLVGGAPLNAAREVASLRFPLVPAEQEEEEIVSKYVSYLKFVVAIGNEVDATNSRLLVQTYQKLSRYDRAAAARFLKGLRYELLQRIDFSGWNPRTVSTNSAEMRRFVARYLVVWVREADEHHFRSYSNQIANRNRE